MNKPERKRSTFSQKIGFVLSAAGAFSAFGYSGRVMKYLFEYILGHGILLAGDGYFGSFISNGISTEHRSILFAVPTLNAIYTGVETGIARVSKFMMPVLVVLSAIIAVYSVTRPARWRT